MSAYKVTVTGNVNCFTSKAGNEIVLSEYYFHDASRPFPFRCNYFGEIKLAAGDYLVPISFDDKNGQLVCSPDFSKAKAV